MNNPATKTFLGLSFLPEHICFVELRDGLIQSLATRELVQPFSVKTFHTEGQFLDNQTEILQELYSEMGAESKEVGVVLDSGMLLIKKIPIALGLEEEVTREHMLWEAEQLLISSLEEYIIDYERLPFQTPLGNPIYVLILIRKGILEGIQTLIQKCGLSLRDLDVDVFTNVRTLIHNYDIDSNQTSVIVDVQRQYLSFIFVRQKEYFLSYRVSLNEDGAVTQIKESSDIVNVLVKELRRLIFGHRLGRGIDDLDSIYLLGGENTQKVSNELSSTVSIPLEVINPFRRVEVSQSVSQSREFNEFPERFVASVGITMKKLSAVSK